MTYVIVLVLLALATAAVLYRLMLSKHAASKNRVRTMRWRIRCHLRPGPGWVTIAGMAWHWSRLRAALGHGAHSRPGSSRWDRLKSHPKHYAVPLGRGHHLRKVYVSMEELTLLPNPPRTGKSLYVSCRIVDNPGPVLATSSKADVYEHTYASRAQIGPVHVFNPQGIGGIKTTFRRNIVAGCEDPEQACRTAAALMGKAYEGSGDMAFWSSKALVALAALVHAAALGSRTIVDVESWVCRDGDTQAERILRDDPRRSGTLLSKLLEIMPAGKLPDSVRGTIGPSIDWVTIPALAEVATPGPGDHLDVADFIARLGTLYLLGSGDDGLVAPLFRCLVQEIHFQASLIASFKPRGKLDPPFLLALDEVCNICPVPLDKWAADSGGRGIPLVVVCHGRAQLESRWGVHGAATIWDTSGIKVYFGGSDNAEHLHSLARLFGQIPVRQHEDRDRHMDVVPPELVRQLPRGKALIVYKDQPPLIVTMQRVTKRRDVRRANRRMLQTVSPAAVAATPVPAARTMPDTIPLPLPDRELVGSTSSNGHSHD